MVFAPTFNVIGADAAPEATVVPFTVTVEVGTAVVGVIVTEAAPFTTLAV